MRNMHFMMKYNDILERRGNRITLQINGERHFNPYAKADMMFIVNHTSAMKQKPQQNHYKKHINTTQHIVRSLDTLDINMVVPNSKIIKEKDTPGRTSFPGLFLLPSNDSDIYLMQNECKRLQVELNCVIQKDRDNEMILEERSVENDLLKEEIEHLKQDLEYARIALDFEQMVMEAKLQTYKSEYEADKEDAERNIHYFRVRLEQERQLNRQLLEQLESLKCRVAPLADEDKKSTSSKATESAHANETETNRENRENREGTHENEIEEDRNVSSIISASCIVCTEKHQYYVPIPCNHPICNECYVQWYASRMHYNDTLLEGECPVTFACPLCRTSIDVTLRDFAASPRDRAAPPQAPAL